MAARASTRPRRIDDALSQLVDSLTPPLSLSALEDDFPDDAEALAAAEEQRHHGLLERSWRVLDAHSHSNNDPSSPSGPAAYGIGRRGSLAGGDNINNASDLIKRKLLKENVSPDKAVRFSNLYSRLLTQPVLSQKWAILYLLYQLSTPEDGDGNLDYDDGRSRSPPLEPGNLQNMLLKGQRTRQGRAMETDDDDGPAISSSASQLPARLERKVSMRRQELEKEREKETGYDPDPDRENRPGTAGRASHVEEPQATHPPPTAQTDIHKHPMPEHVLLRDLPFNLQGLSSSNLEFASSSTLKLPPSLPIPMVSILNALAEPCLLYRGLSTFVESSSGGLLSQSLRAALSNELRSYLGLVATLEGEIRRALAAPEDLSDPRKVTKAGVTLKRCVVWTRDATMALRLMSLIVEEAQSKCIQFNTVLVSQFRLTVS